MKNIILIIIYTICFSGLVFGADYRSDAIYVKYREVPKTATLQSVAGEYTVSSFINDNMFAGKTYSKKADSLLMELKKVRKLVFKHSIDPFKVAKKFAEQANVEFAEPIPINTLDSNETDDPELDRLYHLYITKTVEAWSQMTGDTVLIGIVDTGIDYTHEDLAEKIWHNPAETGLDTNGEDRATNGIDDDGNGFVDDWRGWDFGAEKGYDNDATYGNLHGVHVAGIAAAQVNNGKGVAGMCPNALILPVKVGPDFGVDNSIVNGYEGVIYAASMGCKVINCSWGSTGYSRVSGLAIETASAMGALVVAAAGNSNANEKFYPASYSGVISVASTADDDVRSGFSNYNVSVDISAPGSFIYSTFPENGYDYLSGTSMASPVVAGAAAVLRSQYPEYSAKQIEALLVANTDDISEQNPSYEGVIGSGRLNLLKAIEKVNSKAIALDSYTITSQSKYNIIEAGTKVEVNVNFQNVLDSIDNLEIVVGNDTLFPLDITKSVFDFSGLATGEEFSIDNGLELTIPSNVPEDYNYTLKLTAYSAGVRIQDFYLEFVVNQSFVNLENDKIGLTITSNGNLGYNDFPDNMQGIGFEYGDAKNALFEGGFMLTQIGTKYVADGVRNASSDKSHDLFSISKISIAEDSEKQLVSSAFTDWVEGGVNMNDSTALKIDVTQESFLFKDKDLEQSVLLRYELHNKNSYDMDSVYAGLFFDWDISNSGQSDYVYFDTTNNTGFVESLGDDEVLPKVGVSLLSYQGFNCYAIDNAAFSDEMGIYDGFTEAEKQKTLSAGYGRLKSREKKDVSMVIGAGPIYLPAGGTEVLYFSISLGDDFAKLAEERKALDEKVKRLKELSGLKGEETIRIVKVFPNPANSSGELSVLLRSKAMSEAQMKVYDNIGRIVLDWGKKSLTEGYNRFDFPLSGLSQGAYYLAIEGSGVSISYPFTVLTR